MIDIDVTTKIKQNVVTMLITKTMHGQEHKRVSEGVSLQGVVFISLLVLSFSSLLSPPSRVQGQGRYSMLFFLFFPSRQALTKIAYGG